MLSFGGLYSICIILFFSPKKPISFPFENTCFKVNENELDSLEHHWGDKGEP